jgi:hypothetical protein
MKKSTAVKYMVLLRSNYINFDRQNRGIISYSFIPDGCRFDTLWVHSIFQPHYDLESTQSLTEMSTRNLPGGGGS